MRWEQKETYKQSSEIKANKPATKKQAQRMLKEHHIVWGAYFLSAANVCNAISTVLRRQSRRAKTVTVH